MKHTRTISFMLLVIITANEMKTNVILRLSHCQLHHQIFQLSLSFQQTTEHAVPTADFCLMGGFLTNPFLKSLSVTDFTANVIKASLFYLFAVAAKADVFFLRLPQVAVRVDHAFRHVLYVCECTNRRKDNFQCS